MAPNNKGSTLEELSERWVSVFFDLLLQVVTKACFEGLVVDKLKLTDVVRIDRIIYSDRCGYRVSLLPFSMSSSAPS